jgi:hypothetical protein
MNTPEQTENIYERDDYGFFCDLESQEEVEYYVVTKKTHYEVRRKLVRPKINGPQRTHIIDLSSAKSSTDDLEFISEPSTLQGNSYGVLKFAINFPKNICYPLFMCCTALSCAYFIVTLGDSGARFERRN